MPLGRQQQYPDARQSLPRSRGIDGSMRRVRAPSELSENDMSTASRVVPQESKFRTVFRVVSGNFLEMYDFMVYGYYASAFAKTCFPSGNAFASLMLALSVFGAGLLMRPVGAIVLGVYIDHHGRRKGLILTLAVAAVPGYATIGGFTPAISTLLIHETGNKAAPGLWLGVAAVCGLIATLVLYCTPESRNQYKAV